MKLGANTHGVPYTMKAAYKSCDIDVEIESDVDDDDDRGWQKVGNQLFNQMIL